MSGVGVAESSGAREDGLLIHLDEEVKTLARVNAALRRRPADFCGWDGFKKSVVSWEL